MTKEIDTNKEMQEIQDSQASLVTALESIKGLLAQSEDKLSAARESLSGNRAGTHTAQSTNEPIVPVLDDIVFSEEDETPTSEEPDEVLIQESGEFVETNTHTQIPEPLPLFDNLVSNESQTDVFDTHTNPTFLTETDIGIQDADTVNEQYKEEILQAVDNLQSDLETEIEEIITHTVTNLEIQLRNLVSEKLQVLRKNIEGEDD